MNEALADLRDVHVSTQGAVLLIAYAVAMGGAIGSFLNVVAYRLPLGMSLSKPGSRCPKCEHPIRWYHNIPVFGWIILRGRCRDCGASISWRYPLVELMVAVASGIVAWTAVERVFVDDHFEYLIDTLGVVLRLVVVYLLFCAALLEFDGNRQPFGLLLTVSITLLAALSLVPELRPVQYLDVKSLATLEDVGYSLVVATVLGLLSWPLFFISSRATPADGVAQLLLLVLIALTMGGLAVFFSAVVAGSLMFAQICLLRFRWSVAGLGWAAALLLATLAWMIIAGPSIGSSDSFVRGEHFFQVDDRRPFLVTTAMAVTFVTLFGRLMNWTGQSNTTANE